MLSPRLSPKLFLRIFVVFFAFVLVPISSHAEDISVVTETWEDFTNADGTGFYLDVLREVFPAPQYNLVVSRVPFRRAVLLVEQGKADITTGVYVGDILRKYIVMAYIDKDQVDLVISSKAAKRWQGLHSLKGKKVVAKIGYNFGRFFDVPVQYTEKPTLLGMMKMLGKGRVDAVLDYRKDIQNLWAASGLGDEFTIVDGVIVSKTYFAFSYSNPLLRDHFVQVFPALVRSGKILEIGLKYGLKPENLPH